MAFTHSNARVGSSYTGIYEMLSTTLYKRETLNFVHMLDKSGYRMSWRAITFAIIDVRYTSNLAISSNWNLKIPLFAYEYLTSAQVKLYWSNDKYKSRSKIIVNRQLTTINYNYLLVYL